MRSLPIGASFCMLVGYLLAEANAGWGVALGACVLCVLFTVGLYEMDRRIG